MSGHSKWSTIKRKKGAEDSKRAQVFTRLAKDITIAARNGGEDVSANPALRAAVEKAKASNMPKVNVERAIARGVGKLDGQVVVEAIYEGYGPSGVAVLIKCLTDNKNRTVSEIRSLFNKFGGSLAEAGSVTYVFDSSMDATFTIPLSGEARGRFESLYEELESLDDVVNIYTNVDLI